MHIINDIKRLNVGKVIENVVLKDYTTYKVGGKAICMVIPDDENNLITLIKYLDENTRY